MEFSEKVAVVSGAGSGIGRALTLELLRRGAHVKPNADHLSTSGLFCW